MKLLLDLLQGLEYTECKGPLEQKINQLQYDSRKVAEGDVFVAITGYETDGHKYIPQAIAKGAAAVVCERMPEDIPDTVALICVKDSRKALSFMSIRFFEDPSASLSLIGVTGTNGKTTTTYLMRTILNGAGFQTGVMGTIGNWIGNTALHAERTTPESLELQELLSQMVEEKVTHSIMEVSSHSLVLSRVAGCHFEVGVFTNLTQDHLDFHKTMEEYKKAKGLLFPMCKHSVINMDDPAGEYMAKQAAGTVLTFGIDNNAVDLQAVDLQMEPGAVRFLLKYQGQSYPAVLHIPGRFSVYNALAAIGSCIVLGVDIRDIIKGLAQNQGVKGRAESVANRRGFHAIVDYAHTPDGLENILKTVREFTKGKIITVFGCGGDRDHTKRSIMGEIAGKLSDYCLVTSDNPRKEDPNQILSQIEQGIAPTGCPFELICDRKEAIFRGVHLAEKGDCIVIAGKGHEDYQIFADRTIHFDDVSVVREAFGEDAQ